MTTTDSHNRDEPVTESGEAELCPAGGCVTNSHKFRSLKQHEFIITMSEVRSLATGVGFSAQGLNRAQLNVLARLCSFLEALGKTPLSCSSSAPVKFSPCVCSSKLPASLLAVSQGSLSVPRGGLLPLPCDLSLERHPHLESLPPTL